MKRIAALLLASLVLLSFISCVKQTGSDEPTPDGAGSSVTEATGNEEFIVLDRQCTFSGMAITQLIDTQDTLYYVLGSKSDTIHFSDKKNKEWLPLCIKPDCLHKTKECNAHLEGNCGLTIWVYGDHIYYIPDETDEHGMTALWRMRLDGSGHERILRFDDFDNSEDYTSSSWSFIFHNKYVYAWFRGSNSELIASGEGAHTLVFLVDLSLEKPEMKLTRFVYDTGIPVCGKGETVYCLNTTNNNSIIKADLSTETWDKLCELPLYPESGFVLIGDRLYYADGFFEKQFGYVDTNTGEIVPVLSFDETMRLRMTEEYLIGTGNININGYFSDDNPETGKDTLIYDFDGNLVQRIPYESYNKNITPVYGTGEYMFGAEANVPTKQIDLVEPEWYLDLSEIGDPDMTWRRWAPDGE